MEDSRILWGEVGFPDPVFHYTSECPLIPAHGTRPKRWAEIKDRTPPARLCGECQPRTAETDAHHTVTYAGTSEVARWCGVSEPAVSNWLRRYTTWPVPDAHVGIGRRDEDIIYGWLPERRAEWLDWQQGDRGPMVAL
jgi:hypothetical protein